MAEENNKQLTPMQTRFIHEYQIDMNATQAAMLTPSLLQASLTLPSCSESSGIFNFRLMIYCC